MRLGFVKFSGPTCGREVWPRVDSGVGEFDVPGVLHEVLVLPDQLTRLGAVSVEVQGVAGDEKLRIPRSRILDQLNVPEPR